ncbi:General aromatic amino acid permease [Edwardsiella tarda]|nr:General aromatic amino acid permease [Edwardsiella tarda]
MTRFRAFWYPAGNYLCLIFMAAILVIMFFTPGIQISVLLIPLWLVVLAIGYAIKKQRTRQHGSLSSHG